MSPYEQGFLAKCAEFGLSPELSKLLYGTAEDSPFKRDIPLRNEGFVGKENFLQRNPWIFKFIANQANGKLGNGTRIFQYTHKF